MISLTALGTGTLFSKNNYHSNYLLTVGNYSLMIDCGSDARHSLRDLGLEIKDIDGVYISHLHGDHVGGLEWLGFGKYFGPDDLCDLYASSSILPDLWNKVLSGGMGSLQCQIADLNTYFNVHAISEKNGKFNAISHANYVSCQLVQTCHIMNGFYIVPSFGLMIDTGSQKIFVTSDTQFAPEQLTDFYGMANIIIHDCETSDYESRVHANYKRLVMLPNEIKNKMWLSHYQDDGPTKYNAQVDGFLGFLKKGQTIILKRPGDN